MFLPLTLKRAKLFPLGSPAMTPRRAPILAMIPPPVQHALTFPAGLRLAIGSCRGGQHG
jgi:hypothetical protein